VIVLDASVLIAHFEATDSHHDRASRLLVEAADESLGASALTLAEVFVGPACAGKLDEAKAAVHRLEIVTVGLMENAAERLATLRATRRLRLPDCCVLLAAETAEAAVATFDHHLAAAAAELGLTVRG
jgi:predicted nucleic acid-binding protein